MRLVLLLLLLPSPVSAARKITTVKPDAQRAFDRGLQFVFAFNHDEAIREFTSAVELDPDCAMAEWGVALANGPHINNPEVDAPHAQAAWQAIERAKKLASDGVERALIQALGKRYANPQPGDRKPLDRAYAEAMRAVWQKFPRDPDVGALFAEALMDLRPWDLWTPDGKPQPETDEILRTLEAVLRLDAQHPLANHLYIHAVEASPDPGRADAAADRLRTLAPSLGHLLHMPSHIDVRRGRWAEAVAANERAIAADEKYRATSGFYRLYVLHDWHMLAFASLMRGQSGKSLRAIRQATDMLSVEWVRQNAAVIDGFMAMPLEVLMRFGRWEEILAAPQFPDYLPIARALRHCARGVAFAARGERKKARAEQQAFVIPASGVYGNNSAANFLAVARHLLAGEILLHEGKLDAGIQSLRAAVAAEDALRYDEPPDWIQPVRHALGAALLKAGRAADAEQVYREDLARLPDNGWSLFGLQRCLELQHKDFAEVAARFAKIWVDADVKLSSSCLCLPGA